MPALTVATGSPPASHRPVTTPTTEVGEAAPSNTPPRPPYSPVTPILNHTPLLELDAAEMQEAPLPGPAEGTFAASGLQRPGLGAASLDFNASTPQWGPEPLLVDEPDPIPVIPSENPDVLALRSAISILQMQRQQALSDLRTLSSIKEKAVASPEMFTQELTAGTLRKPVPDGILNLDRPEVEEHDRSPTDTHKDEVGLPQTRHSSPNENHQYFGSFPHAQSIIRMPHINWDKYQVVGDSLDKLHAEQLRRPLAGNAPSEQLLSQRMTDSKPPLQHGITQVRPPANGGHEATAHHGVSSGSGISMPE